MVSYAQFVCAYKGGEEEKHLGKFWWTMHTHKTRWQTQSLQKKKKKKSWGKALL